MRDEWKLIVYDLYNMIIYWQSLLDVKSYDTHLKDFGTKIVDVHKHYKNIASQLEHEITEIEHYNKSLQYHNSRHNRDLINSIGYVANSLFGECQGYLQMIKNAYHRNDNPNCELGYL